MRGSAGDIKGLDLSAMGINNGNEPPTFNSVSVLLLSWSVNGSTLVPLRGLPLIRKLLAELVKLEGNATTSACTVMNRRKKMSNPINAD